MSAGIGTPQTLAEWEEKLTSVPGNAAFTGEDVAELPEPVQKYLRAAIRIGTPLVQGVHLTMRGSIKIGRWLPFRATQLINPHRGFIWKARVAGIIAGSDHYLNEEGGMDWKLAGLFTLAHADGKDASTSAAGRGGAEAIWIPTALLPRFGATWTATDDTHISVAHTIGDTSVEVHYALGPEGHIHSLVFDRWGDPDNTGTFCWHSFGGEITQYRTFNGLTIPSSGRLGWGFATDHWPHGEFFRYEITALHPL